MRLLTRSQSDANRRSARTTTSTPPMDSQEEPPRCRNVVALLSVSSGTVREAQRHSMGGGLDSSLGRLLMRLASSKTVGRISKVVRKRKKTTTTSGRAATRGRALTYVNPDRRLVPYTGGRATAGRMARLRASMVRAGTKLKTIGTAARAPASPRGAAAQIAIGMLADRMTGGFNTTGFIRSVRSGGRLLCRATSGPTAAEIRRAKKAYGRKYRTPEFRAFGSGSTKKKKKKRKTAPKRRRKSYVTYDVFA